MSDDNKPVHGLTKKSIEGIKPSFDKVDAQQAKTETAILHNKRDFAGALEVSFDALEENPENPELLENYKLVLSATQLSGNAHLLINEPAIIANSSIDNPELSEKLNNLVNGLTFVREELEDLMNYSDAFYKNPDDREIAEKYETALREAHMLNDPEIDQALIAEHEKYKASSIMIPRLSHAFILSKSDRDREPNQQNAL